MSTSCTDAHAFLGESIFPIESGWMYMRQTPIRHGIPTVLCVHGIGESGLSFREVAELLLEYEVNVVVPDLLGYGRSSGDKLGDYSFERHINCLSRIVNGLQLTDICLVGHSMGGDVATLMCQQTTSPRIWKLVNVEGNLTEADCFICSKAVLADEQEVFEQWLRSDFVREDSTEPMPAALARYYASVWYCRPDAFLANAKQMFAMNRDNEGQVGTIGKTYAGLDTDRVYCWASLKKSSRQLLLTKGLKHREFPGASHWIMIDQSEEFVAFLAEFLALKRKG